MKIANLTNKERDTLENRKGKVMITVYIHTDPSILNGRRAEYRTLLKSIKKNLVKKLDITLAEDVINQLSAFGNTISSEGRHGTALLLSDSQDHHLYFVDYIIPTQIFLGSTYELTPLKAGQAPEQKFFVLTLSKAGTKLFSGNDERLHIVKLPAIRKGYKETLGLEDSGKELNYHTEGGSELYHGQDDSIGNEKKYLVNYFRIIDKTVNKVISPKDSTIVLAGVGYLADLYRGISNNKHLATNIIHGNMDRVSDQDLWQRAFPIARALDV